MHIASSMKGNKLSNLTNRQIYSDNYVLNDYMSGLKTGMRTNKNIYYSAYFKI